MRALPNVAIHDGCEAVGLAASTGSQTVVGARVCRVGDGQTEKVLPADLVVDTTGRSGRTTSWLPAMGFEPPAKDELAVHVGYATQHLRIAPGTAPREMLIIIGGGPRLLTAAENDRAVPEQFSRVNNLLDPPTRLLRPSVVRRVIGANLRRRRNKIAGIAVLSASPSGEAIP